MELGQCNFFFITDVNTASGTVVVNFSEQAAWTGPVSDLERVSDMHIGVMLVINIFFHRKFSLSQ